MSCTCFVWEAYKDFKQTTEHLWTTTGHIESMTTYSYELDKVDVTQPNTVCSGLRGLQYEDG